MKQAAYTRLAFTILLAATTIFTASGAPAEVIADQTEKTVTLQVNKMPVIDAIDLLFQGTGYKYRIEPGVSGTITLSLDKVPLDQAVRTIAETVGIDWRISGGKYVFSRKAPLVAEVEQPSELQPPDVQPIPEPVAPPVASVPYYSVQPSAPYVPYAPYTNIGGVGIFPSWGGYNNFLVIPGYQPPGPYLANCPYPLPPSGLIVPSVQSMFQRFYAEYPFPFIGNAYCGYGGYGGYGGYTFGY